MSATTDALLPGWQHPVHDAQATFRAVLQAMAAPGTVLRLPVAVAAPYPMNSATTAICLALADFETPVWLGPAGAAPAAEAYLRFHCGCPITAEAGEAAFAILTDFDGDLLLERFGHGTMEYPDRSATLLVQVDSLDADGRQTLYGPGIEHSAPLRVGSLGMQFIEQWGRNGRSFPLGVDLVFCCGQSITALPRTTRIASSADTPENLPCT